MSVRSNNKTVRGAAIALILSAMVAVAPNGNAQQPERAGTPKEGIVVHGYWTIDIRQPDGTLVSHNEFENALQAGGAALLTGLLSRQMSAGRWEVALWPAVSNQPPCQGAVNAPCLLDEPTESLTSANRFKTLTVTATAANTVVLAGSATASADGGIGTVVTALQGCAATIAPEQCPASAQTVQHGLTTRASLSTPITVFAGQIIQVTVTLSFS